MTPAAAGIASQVASSGLEEKSNCLSTTLINFKFNKKSFLNERVRFNHRI